MNTFVTHKKPSAFSDSNTLKVNKNFPSESARKKSKRIGSKTRTTGTDFSQMFSNIKVKNSKQRQLPMNRKGDLNPHDYLSNVKLPTQTLNIGSAPTQKKNSQRLVGSLIELKERKFRIIDILGKGGFGTVFKVLLQVTISSKDPPHILELKSCGVGGDISRKSKTPPRINRSDDSRRLTHITQRYQTTSNISRLCYSPSQFILDTQPVVNPANSFALKMIKTNLNGIPCLTEAITSSCIQHKHINRIIDSSINSNSLFLLEELADQDLNQWAFKESRDSGTTGSRLTSNRKHGSTKLIKDRYMLQISIGLNYMHSMGFIHGDLKLGNFFLTGDLVKIGDHGLVKAIGWPNKGFFGTLSYSAPELLTEKCDRIDDKLDSWSLGCCFFKLYYGQELFPYQEGIDQKDRRYKHILSLLDFLENSPFKQENDLREYILENRVTDISCGIRKINLPPSFHLEINQQFNGLLKLLLVYFPDKRSKVSEIVNNSYFSETYLPKSDLSDISTYQTYIGTVDSEWCSFLETLNTKGFISRFKQIKSKTLRRKNINADHVDDLISLSRGLWKQLMFVLEHKNVDLRKEFGSQYKKTYLVNIIYDTCYWMAYKVIFGKILGEEFYLTKIYEILRMERLFCSLTNFMIDLKCK